MSSQGPPIRIADARPHLGLPAGDHFTETKPPYVAQFNTREITDPVLHGQVAAEDDPLWAASGFETPSEYAYWGPRLCGLACLKMCLEAYGCSLAESLAEVTHRGVSLGGYKIETDSGWFYAPLVEMAETYGLHGVVHRSLDEETILSNVLKDRLTVPSVTSKVIRFELDESPNGRKGGHLVVVFGFRWDGTQVEGFFLHNSSGARPETQESVFVPIDRFREAFAGRGYSVWRN
jgi:hypothetical protein